MKLITSIIKPFKLEEVRSALSALGGLRYDRDRGERPGPPARFCSACAPRGRSRAPHGGI
jgi:hypothetical protein